jgi:hypothetical protein
VKVSLASATPLLAALLWVVALLIDPGPFAAWPVLLIGLALVELATVSVVGMVISGGRWARRSALAVVATTLLIAVARPLDPIWVIALIASTLAGASMFTRSVTRGIRRLPAASGPPERAVLIPLILIGFPGFLGLATWDSSATTTLIVGLAAPIAALWYSRVLPGGLVAVRLLWPALAVALSPTQGLAPGTISLLGGVLVAFLAWDKTVKVAFHPPRETGSAYSIPPELAPREILDAAGLDEKGRPRA